MANKRIALLFLVVALIGGCFAQAPVDPPVDPPVSAPVAPVAPVTPVAPSTAPTATPTSTAPVEPPTVAPVSNTTEPLNPIIPTEVQTPTEINAGVATVATYSAVIGAVLVAGVIALGVYGATKAIPKLTGKYSEV